MLRNADPSDTAQKNISISPESRNQFSLVKIPSVIATAFSKFLTQIQLLDAVYLNWLMKFR